MPLAKALGTETELIYREKLGELQLEVKELQARLGFSGRRKANARLKLLGLQEIEK